MKVTICGAGVGGVALACQLVERGHEVRLVEIAPELRAGGYMIDFFGPGYDTAERMELLDPLAGIHQHIDNLVFVDADGSERLRIPYRDVRAAFGGRHFNFPRGDLARVLYERLNGRAEVTFGTTVAAYEHEGDRVRVHLENGEEHVTDLLVGADGIHSRIRDLMRRSRGDESDPIRFLGYHAISFTVPAGAVPEITEPAFYMYSAPHHVASVYPESGQLVVFLAHDADAPPADRSAEAVRRVLEERYADAGWIFGRVLDGFDPDQEVYFDEVSQVELAQWSDGAVTLLGDACQCVSLLAGQGASLAMGGAEVLARQLDAAGSVEDALARYQARMGPAVARKQKSGRRMADWFVPATQRHVVLSRVFMRMLKVPGLRRLAASGVDSSAIGN